MRTACFASPHPLWSRARVRTRNTKISIPQKRLFSSDLILDLTKLLEAKHNLGKITELETKHNFGKITELETKHNFGKITELELEAKHNLGKITELEAKHILGKMTELAQIQNFNSTCKLLVNSNLIKNSCEFAARIESMSDKN